MYVYMFFFLLQDENVSLSDLNPESASNSIVVRQTLQVCEALMAHCVTHSKGVVVSVDGKTLLGLHKTYCQLLDFVKVKKNNPSSVM